MMFFFSSFFSIFKDMVVVTYEFVSLKQDCEKVYISSTHFFRFSVNFCCQSGVVQDWSLHCCG